MKISSMKFKDIRCAFYYSDGKAQVTYNTKKIEEMQERNLEVVIMNNPTKEQREEIISKLQANDGELNMNGSAILDCIKTLTTLEVDVTDEEAEELINNPNDMLELINLECNVIILDIFKTLIKESNAIASLPDSLKVPLMQEVQEQIEKDKEEMVKREQEAKEIEEQMKAMQERLAQLGKTK